MLKVRRDELLQRAATSSIQAFYRGAIWYNTIVRIGSDSAVHQVQPCIPIGTGSAVR